LSPLVYVFAAALTTFSSAEQPAVQASGQITGTVSDSDGAVVTAATIALESQLTHEQNTSKSDGTGIFNFTALSPGVFHVTISAKGVADWTGTDIVLKSGQDYELADITLTIPSVNVSVQALSQHEIAAEQVKVEETQRILGVVPNYYAVYDWNAAPLSPKLKFSLDWKTELDPFSVVASGVIAGCSTGSTISQDMDRARREALWCFGCGYLQRQWRSHPRQSFATLISNLRVRPHTISILLFIRWSIALREPFHPRSRTSRFLHRRSLRFLSKTKCL
jgi:hypothetical protein